MEGQPISGKYNNKEEIFDKVVETKLEIEKIKKEKSNYLAYIHCNNCFKKCALSNPYCGRGKNLQNKF